MSEKLILQKLVEHDERLDELDRKIDQLPTKEELFSKLDGMFQPYSKARPGKNFYYRVGKKNRKRCRAY